MTGWKRQVSPKYGIRVTSNPENGHSHITQSGSKNMNVQVYLPNLHNPPLYHNLIDVQPCHPHLKKYHHTPPIRPFLSSPNTHHYSPKSSPP